MAVSPAYARTMVGQWVECDTAYGTHVGMLHEVRRDGIVLAIPRGGVGPASGSGKVDLKHADQPAALDVTEVFFPGRRFFNPFFFFFPFFLLFALRRRFF